MCRVCVMGMEVLTEDHFDMCQDQDSLVSQDSQAKANGHEGYNSVGQVRLRSIDWPMITQETQWLKGDLNLKLQGFSLATQPLHLPHSQQMCQGLRSHTYAHNSHTSIHTKNIFFCSRLHLFREAGGEVFLLSCEPVELDSGESSED